MMIALETIKPQPPITASSQNQLSATMTPPYPLTLRSPEEDVDDRDGTHGVVQTRDYARKTSTKAQLAAE